MKPALLLCETRDTMHLMRKLRSVCDLDIVIADVAPDSPAPENDIHRLSAFLGQDLELPRIVHAQHRANHIVSQLRARDFRTAYPEIDGITWRRFVSEIESRTETIVSQGMRCIDAVRTCASSLDLRAVILGNIETLQAKAVQQAARRLGIPTILDSTDERLPCNSDDASDLVVSGDADAVAAAALRIMRDDPTRWTRPLDRYPDIEQALASALPPEKTTVLVVGQAAAYASAAIRRRRPEVRVCVEAEIRSDQLFDAIVIADPIPHSGNAETALGVAAGRLNPNGMLVAGFRNGGDLESTKAFLTGAWYPPSEHGEPPNAVGQYCRSGIDVVLSRCDLECIEVVPLPTFMPVSAVTGPDSDLWIPGWIALAMKR